MPPTPQLGLLFRSSLTLGSAAGLRAVAAAGVENVNLSAVVGGHSDWTARMADVIEVGSRSNQKLCFAFAPFISRPLFWERLLQHACAPPQAALLHFLLFFGALGKKVFLKVLLKKVHIPRAAQVLGLAAADDGPGPSAAPPAVAV